MRDVGCGRWEPKKRTRRAGGGLGSPTLRGEPPSARDPPELWCVYAATLPFYPMGLQEIEHAITDLPRDQQRELFSWIDELRAAQWDDQIAADAKEGRLDDLIARAKRDYREGRTRPL